MAKLTSRLLFVFYIQTIIVYPLSVGDLPWNKEDAKCYNGEMLCNNMSSYEAWLPKVFPMCWSFLTLVRSHSDQVPLCEEICMEAIQNCEMVKSFIGSTRFDNLVQQLNCSDNNERDCSKNVTNVADTSVCGYPLIPSKVPDNWVVSWQRNQTTSIRKDGCALSYNSQLKWSHSNEKTIHGLIVAFTFIALLACCFTILSFMVDWKNQKRYPAFILLIMNVCFAFCLLGWLIQLTTQYVACNHNNERRINQAIIAESFPCILSFILIYFFSVAASCWFLLLSISWKYSFQRLRSTTKKFTNEHQINMFHCFVWFFSTVATIVVLAAGHVDGHEFVNICYVGYQSKEMRNVFVLLPFSLLLLVGELFLIAGIFELIKLRSDCSLLLIVKATQNITHTIYRLVIYSAIILFSILSTIGCCVYDDIKRDQWLAEYKTYIKCRLVHQGKFDSSSHCQPPSLYRIYLFYVQFSALISCCLATSSWTWTQATIKTWIKVWKKYRHVDIKMKAQKTWYHRMRKKKIEPFIPPIDPNNPLESKIISPPYLHQQGVNQDGKLFPPFPGLKQPSAGSRRHSDDIRTVANLFSARRGSKFSIKSYDSASLKRSMSLGTLQSFGHLARDFATSRPASNLTIGNHSELPRGSSNLTLDYFNHLRNNVFTPLSTVHRNNIVADCIPYMEDVAQEQDGTSSIGPWSLRSGEMEGLS